MSSYCKLLAFLWQLTLLHFVLIFIYATMNPNIEQIYKEQASSE